MSELFYYLLGFMAGFSVSLAFQLLHNSFEDIDSSKVWI